MKTSSASPSSLATRPVLIQRLADPADGAAWHEFQQSYADLVHGYVAAQIGSRGARPDAQRLEEITAEVFGHLWLRLPRFTLDLRRGRFRTWLWRFVQNFVTDAERRRTIEKLRAPDAIGFCAAKPQGRGVEEQHPELHLLLVTLESVKRELLASHPAKWRCFDEHRLQGRPAADVAADLGITAALVWQNASRVLATVRTRVRATFASL